MKSINLTADQMATARKIGETLIAQGKGKATVDDLRTVMRESRERWGEDMHNVIKGRAIAGATGGRA